MAGASRFGIFVNYRREDASGHAGRLAADLGLRFPAAQIFQDIDRIDPGADFIDTIKAALEQCDVVLVVIGPAWTRVIDKKGRRRLENPNDFVALEIVSALQRKIRVIPVLVGGADMPDPEELPEQIKELTRRQAHEITDSRWKYDVDQLSEKIRRLAEVKKTETVPRPPEPRPIPNPQKPTPQSPPGQGDSVSRGQPPPATGSGKKRKIVGIISGGLIVIGLTVLFIVGRSPTKLTVENGAAAPQTPNAPKAIEVRIGHVAPLTGGIAHLGKDNENGARLAIDEANAAEVKIGGANVTFKLLAEDDAAEPRTGVTVAQKLVDARVAGVVGHLNSGTSIPAAPIYASAGIPVISGSATNPKLTELGFRSQFRAVGRDDQQGPAIATYIASQRLAKVVAIVDDATAYGEGVANGVESRLRLAGIRVLPREKGTDKTTEWKAVLTKIRTRSPDAIFYGGMDATAGPLLRQARDLGVHAVFAFGDGACTDMMSRLAGRAAEGMVCSQAGIPPEYANRRFVAAYKKKFHADPILYAPYTYDAAKLLIEAMKQAESTEPRNYLPVLRAITYKGATGTIQFDEKGDRRDSEITIFTMAAGRIEPLAFVRGERVFTASEFSQLAQQ